MKLFNPNQFTPTQWETAEQKAKFANQFVSFTESDFSITKFPNWFYQRLSNCFGNIARTNQIGFYSTYFESVTGKINFIQNCLSYALRQSPTT